MPRRKRFTRNLGRLTIEPMAARRPDARYVRLEHPAEHLGVFTYVDDAREVLDDPGRRELDTLMSWFDKNLKKPSRLVPFRQVGKRAHRRRWAEASAICWFREEATEHLARARRVAELVQNGGIPIVERTVTRVPGKLCFEDEFQIAVEAYRDARSEVDEATEDVLRTTSRPAIIVQRIRVEWTKASRGAPGASKRASIADALALPARQTAAAVLVHDVVARESNAFELVDRPQLPARDRATAWRADRGFLGPVEWVALDDGSLAVSFRPQGTGAPRRPLRRVFDLQPGQWGKLVVNERITVEETWLYAQSVVNVAFITRFRTDIFVETQPVAVANLRARLR